MQIIQIRKTADKLLGDLYDKKPVTDDMRKEFEELKKAWKKFDDVEMPKGFRETIDDRIDLLKTKIK